MAVLAIGAILLAVSITGFSRWAAAEAQAGAATTLQSVLRQSQVRAVTQGLSICVTFDTAADTYTVHRYACDTAPLEHIAGPFAFDGNQDLASAAFTAPNGTVHSAVTFRSSGTAWPGTIVLRRDGSSKTYRIDVEGLTGRVSLSSP